MPKRKSNPSVEDDGSPSKRRTRSTAALDSEHVMLSFPTPTRKRGPPGIPAKKMDFTTVIDAENDPAYTKSPRKSRGRPLQAKMNAASTPPEAETPTKTRGRPPKPQTPNKAKGTFTPTKVILKVTTPTRRSLRKDPVVPVIHIHEVEKTESVIPDSEASVESDELNISPNITPSKSAQRRGTPARTLRTPQPSSPQKRMILHSVEITTPSRLLGSSTTGTPTRPISPTPKLRKVARRAPTPGPSTPRKVKVDVVTPSRVIDLSPVKSSPRKRVISASVLPAHLQECLSAQKLAVLSALRNPPEANLEDDDEDESIAFSELSRLLAGSVERGEGNSCLVIGPRGSGKSRIFEQALSTLSTGPLVIRLSGHVHTNDRLAMRDIARQVMLQTPRAFTSTDSDNMDVDDDNPFSLKVIDNQDQDTCLDLANAIPPSAQLSSMISALPSLPKPVVVVLDAFDLFTSHARQALLYCLLDTVQSCRASGTGTTDEGKARGGLAVIGLTPRVDVMNLLEKRVKSRFSHRILMTSGLTELEQWNKLLYRCLSVGIPVRNTEASYPARGKAAMQDEAEADGEEEWDELWRESVQDFLAERNTQTIIHETFDLTRDIRILTRIVTSAVLGLSSASPFLTASSLQAHAMSQKNSPHIPRLSSLSYPAMSLLIAVQQSRVSGNEVFTFEMLHQSFRDQVRISSAAPVMVAGGSIGMVNVARGVLFGAFEHLVQIKLFRPAGTADAGLAREFLKYRCVVEREEVKAAVEAMGQTNLKKWMNKAQ